MQLFDQKPTRILEAQGCSIASFITGENYNMDIATVKSFGEEWTQFNDFSLAEIENAALEYFDIVPEALLNKSSNVLDLGCGSGRWSLFLADRVGTIESIDPSDSVFGASRLLSSKKNVRVSQASVSNIPFKDGTFDFLLCLGVLHHIPDTQEALNYASKKIKSGGYALLYFYYNLENRSHFYKLLFSITDIFRKRISKFPGPLKKFCCDLIAFMIYWPLILISKLMKWTFPGSAFYKKIPLSYYVNKPWKIVRNDALDRFGTPLEQRFTREQIAQMLRLAGFGHVEFSPNMPYWHCLAQKN